LFWPVKKLDFERDKNKKTHSRRRRRMQGFLVGLLAKEERELSEPSSISHELTPFPSLLRKEGDYIIRFCLNLQL